MDKYDASHDHYCYPASSVLKNKLNIQEMAALEAAERDITALTVSRVRYAGYLDAIKTFLIEERFSEGHIETARIELHTPH